MKPIGEVIARCLCAQAGLDPDGGARTGFSWLDFEKNAKQILRAIMRNTTYEIHKYNFMEASDIESQETGVLTASWLVNQKKYFKDDLTVVQEMSFDEFIKLATYAELPFE